MIAFVVGTTAELIKIAPVVHACEARGGSCCIWFTGQHVAQVPELVERLRLPQPELWFARGAGGRDLTRPVDVPAWVAAVVRTAWQQRRVLRERLRSDGRVPLVVVHGDTFSTVLGSLLGRALGVDVAHVEAGLRSGSLRSPFPEEANRRIVGRLAALHFPPTPREVDNLSGRRADVVLTGANTVVDSLKLLREGQARPEDLPERYAVSTLHRFELLQDREAFTAVLGLLAEAARDLPVLFHAGAPERARLQEYGLLQHFTPDRLVLRPKLPYLDFLPVLAGASWVVTDSGGLQEECAYLGMPCAVHRERTERHQGLGSNVVLTGMDLTVLRRFLAEPDAYRRGGDLDAHQPSQTIADALTERGHL